MAEYKARLLRVYRIPVISTVIYLRGKKGSQKDTGIFEQNYPQRFLAEYNVIRLWEMNGEEALKKSTPGSLPFIPLMEPPEDCSREEWLSKCVSVAYEITPQEHLPNLLFSMSVLSGLVISDTDTVETIIPEEIMKESAFYQHIVNKARAEGLAEGEVKGEAKGKVEGLVEGLLALIKNRFTSIPKTISSKIKSIHDKNTLLRIQKMAIDAKTKKEFVETFNALNI
jgi:predicted transposase YdaD